MDGLAVLVVATCVVLLWMWVFASGLMDQVEFLKREIASLKYSNDQKMDVIRVLKSQRQQLANGAPRDIVNELASMALDHEPKLAAYREYLFDE